MEAKDVQSLQEAYASMYTTSEEATDLQESVETVEEGIMGALKKVGKAVLGPADQSPEAEAARMGKRRGPGTAGSPKPKKQQPAAGAPKKQQPASMKEDADVFDIVKDYLMTEHDATEEEALKVMLELTDEERTSIVEGIFDFLPKSKTVVPGKYGKDTVLAKKGGKEGVMNKKTGEFTAQKGGWDKIDAERYSNEYMKQRPRGMGDPTTSHANRRVTPNRVK